MISFFINIESYIFKCKFVFTFVDCTQLTNFSFSFPIVDEAFNSDCDVIFSALLQLYSAKKRLGFQAE